MPEPAAISESKGLSGRIATWTVVILAMAGLIDAMTAVISKTQSLTCVFGVHFTWCAALPLPNPLSQSPTPSVTALPPPAVMSLTCRYTSGPRQNETQDFAGVPGVRPAPIGASCTDGNGSYGIAMASSSTICQFKSGWHDYAPMTPVQIGTACHDGAGNDGQVVAKGLQTGPQL